MTAAFSGDKNASKRNMPPKAICISIRSHLLHEVLSWAELSSAPVTNRRDAALLISFTVFGLRRVIYQPILFDYNSLNEQMLQVLVRKLKGRTLQTALRIGERSFFFPQVFQGTRIPFWV